MTKCINNKHKEKPITTIKTAPGGATGGVKISTDNWLICKRKLS